MTYSPNTRECFGIYDVALNVYSDPFYSTGEIEARRAVYSFLRNHPDSIQAQHADVFQLHHLGGFDIATGEYTNNTGDKFICSLAYLLPKAVDKPTVTD